jgi:hypothetical protein
MEERRVSENAMSIDNTPEDDTDFEVDISASGLLWYLNRVGLHPRGFALAGLYNAPRGTEDRHLIGFTLLGDGSEPWGFPDEVDDEYFARVEATFSEARRRAQNRDIELGVAEPGE